MRILITAIACHPEWGSEAKFGWDAAQAISDFAECHVVTQPDSRSGIEQHHAGGEARLNFHYFGKHHTCHPNRMVARLQTWLTFVRWQEGLLRYVSKLHANHNFDIVHQVTYATWRVPSPLWKLPIPFVWGPLGGGSSTPGRFYPTLSKSSQRFETLRSLSATVSAIRPAFRACVRKATSVVAAEKETASFLQRYRGSNDVQVLCPAFFSQSQVDWFSGAEGKSGVPQTPLSLFGGGNLEGRKGVAMALHAVARLKANGILATYTLGGGGPERTHLEQLASKLGISDAVIFSGGFSGDEYRKQLAQTDIYLLPSLRETAGITMMEAMLAGCYSIVLAGTGAGDIVAKTGGAALQAKDPKEAISKISEQLEWCHFHRQDMAQRAQDAAVKIRALYSKDAYQKVIREIYAESLEKHRQKIRRK